MAKKKKPVIETLDSILDQKEGKALVVPDSLPSAPVFPPKGMTFEPNGRGLVPAGKLDVEYERFLNEIAPLEDLRIALAQSGGEKALAFLADIIRHHKLNQKNAPKLVTLAKRNGLSMDQIADIWKNYSVAKGLTMIASAAPQIANHTIGDALSTEIICPRCDGEGKIERRPRPDPECPTCFGLKKITKVITSALGEEVPLQVDCPRCNVSTWVGCKNCNEKGTVRKVGDAKSKEILFEALGVTKSKQPAIQVNINHSVESVLDELDRTVIHPTYTKS